MALERDHAAERLDRINLQLAAAKRTMQGLKPTDRDGVRELKAKLDEWLKELLGVGRRAAVLNAEPRQKNSAGATETVGPFRPPT